jgi:murein DD-endopeptidase MepM/ murein hydrolase activator NlpD
LNNFVSEVKEIKNNLEVDKKIYQEKYNTLSEQKEDLSDKKKLVEQNKKENDKLLKETKSKEEVYQKKLAERKKTKDGLEKETLDFESKLKSIVDTSLLPKVGAGILAYPVKKILITQYFGNTSFSTKNPQVYNGAGHNGIDFGIPIGTALYSAADGVVIGVDDSDVYCRGASYGKWVLIKHNNGLTTLYAHMSSFAVSEGQSVKSGEKIGLSGNTGYSTGPHLHFTVYASQAVKVSGPTEYKSKSCGTYMRIPIAPRNAYLNPLSYF